jgi:hypothetical protein
LNWSKGAARSPYRSINSTSDILKDLIQATKSAYDKFDKYYNIQSEYAISALVLDRRLNVSYYFDENNPASSEQMESAKAGVLHYYALPQFVPSFLKMTKIKNDVSVKLIALSEAGLKPSKIARQLNLNYETVKKHLYRKKLVDGLPPKVKVKKGNFTGRIPGIIRRYLEDYPIARLDDIINACELKCHKATLCKWLNKNGFGQTKAKRNILLREVNRAKRIKICKEMLTLTVFTRNEN